MKNHWIVNSNNWNLREVSQQKETLENVIFKVNIDPRTEELYLSKIKDKFTFPYKIYGVESKFIARVKKTYENTKGNLGILMNGVKGTGKTVTSELICNELNLPVIVVNEAYDSLPTFINQIHQDVLFFFDEYEKIYDKKDYSILTVMDGVLNTDFRKTFILTTNELYINDNLLQRPGRIRYFKTFGELELETIIEIVDDKLIHLDLRDKTINFISKLDKITVDIVKSITDEVNIHHEDPELFKDVFNVREISDRKEVYELDKASGKMSKIYSNAKMSQVTLQKGYYISFNDDEYLGRIAKIEDDGVITVDTDDFDENGKQIQKVYKIETSEAKNTIFRSYFV